jgi:hypothetical protein
MPKINPLYSFRATFTDVTEVDSKKYGKYVRRPRGTVKPAVLNEAFKKSITLNSVANPAAKAIKDALNPFRLHLIDGTMWSRLVGLLKRSLAQDPIMNLSVLAGFELHNKNRLFNKFYAAASANVLQDGEPTLHLELTSETKFEEKYDATGYVQTIVVVFLDSNLGAVTSSKEITMPMTKEVQSTQWPVPPGTTWIVIALKCLPFSGKKEISKPRTRGMRIVKVIGLPKMEQSVVGEEG